MPEEPVKMDLCEISRRYGHAAILRMRDNARTVTAADIAALSQSNGPHQNVSNQKVSQTREPRIRFFDTDELAEYVPSHDVVLAGDCHLMRGEVFVIGGEPGVGKSRAATALAVAGATGGQWLGLQVHRPFRTMIIQTENGRYRLRQEFAGLDYSALKGWVRVSEPPPFGITLGNLEFQADIRAALAAFRPDCVILDPWNAAARDDKQRDYSETFDALRNLLPTGPDKPALGIVAHTRKPQTAEKRTGGTGLMHILAGSYMLTSVPRCVFVMTRASEDESDDRVVWFNPKNNNGNLVPRSAWVRHACGFEAVAGFDWDAFENTEQKGNRSIVTLGHLHEVFESCDSMELSEAVDCLSSVAGIAAKSAYAALDERGKFARYLVRSGKTLRFRP